MPRCVARIDVIEQWSGTNMATRDVCQPHTHIVSIVQGSASIVQGTKR
jgi:hypothetical protein